MKWTILLACSLGLCPSATQLATAFVGLSVDPSAFQRNLQRTRTNTHDLSNEVWQVRAVCTKLRYVCALRVRSGTRYLGAFEAW